MEDYKDPKDLRDIPLERLKYEANQLGHQFTEWNNLFNVESAIRVKGALAPINYQANPNQFSELERWSIYSNRFLIMGRDHLTDYKLFTKDEVLMMIEEAYYEGYNDADYKDKEGNKNELAAAYVHKNKVKL